MDNILFRGDKSSRSFYRIYHCFSSQFLFYKYCHCNQVLSFKKIINNLSRSKRRLDFILLSVVFYIVRAMIKFYILKNLIFYFRVKTIIAFGLLPFENILIVPLVGSIIFPNFLYEYLYLILLIYFIVKTR